MSIQVIEHNKANLLNFDMYRRLLSQEGLHSALAGMYTVRRLGRIFHDAIYKLAPEIDEKDDEFLSISIGAWTHTRRALLTNNLAADDACCCAIDDASNYIESRIRYYRDNR